MSAESILRMAARRMWRFWTPLIAVMLIIFSLTVQLDSGVSGLSALVSLMLVIAGCGDWFISDRAAYNAERVSAG